ncbi:MAG: FadR family transcriptional regulator [Anaerolineales bacterium]|nr:FadR family transcriptional regulator [Anaerolineales bacterium]MCA9930609.1 FadR family transcriptional regulator [Anaerolineales bacterium]
MAEQVATAVKDAILAGDFAPGAALPTEPELSADFGVSRAVIRDATRMLAAQGLVVAEHGRGVFVTDSQVEAFGEALLLALRRADASVWDVEQFEQILYPEVGALAAVQATDTELDLIQQKIDAYLTLQQELHVLQQAQRLSSEQIEQLSAAFRKIITALFAATHNAVLQLLAQPLLELHSVRDWEPEEPQPIEEVLAFEASYLKTFMEAVASRNPEHAHSTIKQLMKLPAEAETAMRHTPVGETPLIPLPLHPITLRHQK